MLDITPPSRPTPSAARIRPRDVPAWPLELSTISTVDHPARVYLEATDNGKRGHRSAQCARRIYVKPIEDGDEKAVENLRARIRPFIMRRRKEDVASELPPKTGQTIFLHPVRPQPARALRPHPVMVYRLVVEHSVEQKMVELGAEKRKVAETALGRDATIGKKLTMEDVDELLATPVASPWDDV